MAFTARQSISLVFPAYNEALNIEKSVAQAVQNLERLGTDWEVVVVNDGSRDETGAIIDRLASENPRVVAVHHAKNGGYGAALTTGIRTASKELILLCDSDLQFHLGETPLLMLWIEQHDAVIGYRATRRDHWHRKLNAWGWNMVVRTTCGVKVRDVDCAFKLYRREIFNHFTIDSRGAMVSAEILAKITRLGFSVKQVPVTHFSREAGNSTGANLRVIAKAFSELAGVRNSISRLDRVVQPHERRREAAYCEIERRRRERRAAVLPINFPDRRGRKVASPPEPPSAPVPMPEAAAPVSVAMVLASPFPANHGTPAGVKETAHAVAGRGHDVHVVTYHFGEGPDPHGLKVHRIPGLGLRRKVVVGPTLAKPLQDALLVLRLIEVIWRRKIQVIHAHNFEGALVGYLASLVTGRPVIYNAVCTMSDELESYGVFPPGMARRLAAFLDKWVPRWADSVVSISSELTDSLHASGVAREKLNTIPLGVSFDPFLSPADGEAVRAKLGLGSAPLVIYTGTLDRFQRLDYLFMAMRRVIDAMPQAKLLVAGGTTKDEDMAACRAQVQSLGIAGHVMILRDTTFEEVPAMLAASQVAVAPRPACPGVPIKLLNYVAASMPIVTFDGSAKGLVHGQTALLAADHDWQAFGDHMLALLRDPVLARSLGEAAHRWAQANLSWSSHAQRLESVYQGVLGTLDPRVEPVATPPVTSALWPAAAPPVNNGVVASTVNLHHEAAG